AARSSGHIDGKALTQGKAGMWSGTHARRDGRMRVVIVGGVRIDGREIVADAVVVAAGAWAPVTLAPLGIRLAVEPQRGQIIHLKMPGADTLHWATMQPLNGYCLLAFEDGRVVIGA